MSYPTDPLERHWTAESPTDVGRTERAAADHQFRVWSIAAHQQPHEAARDAETTAATLVPEAHGLLDTALAYATLGWPVLPIHDTIAESCSCGRECASAGKHPRTPHGVHDATTDPDVIRAWWEQWPTANVAIATGPTSVDVLDVDVKPGGTGYPALERLRQVGLLRDACARVRTRSGGLHLYFRPIGQGNSALPGHYLDLRGSGGYVLAPPSRVHPGVYQLLEWRPDRAGTLDWDDVRRVLSPARPRHRRPPSRPGTADTHHFARWLRQKRSAPGNRNNALYWAACAAIDNSATDLDALLEAAIDIGLSQAEASSTINSARNRQEKAA